MKNETMIRVGHVVAPFGVQGAVKVKSLTDFQDRFEAGSELFLDGLLREVEWSRHGAGAVIVKLVGVDTRDLAELIRGQYLEIPAESARSLGEGHFYHHQLIGLAVMTESGKSLGTIDNVLERPANDVWVAGLEGIERLIPAVRDVVVNVDLEAGKVTVADWIAQPEEVVEGR